MLSRLLSPLREFGWWSGWAYLIDRALGTLSPAMRLYVYDLMVQPVHDQPLLPRGAGSLEVRCIRPGDPEFAALPIRPSLIEARLRQHARCVAALRRGELIGYMWFCPQRYEEDEVRCDFELEPGDSSVFDFDFFVQPEHRLGRAFAALWDGANVELRRLGVARTFSRVSRFNTASRRSHAQLGARRIGVAAFLCLGPLQIAVSSRRPFVSVTLRPARSRLVLRA